ncbi:MAG: ubiquinol-cytochrome c reductase iron-sulfur subunit [Gammaproteobacteria bacterium]|nr:ubiquinol-cytochrome c reductase iron-sulfur subunit [Gammaproteobacteria bacterium]
MADHHVDHKRRRMLTIATTGVGLAGTVGMAVPFAGSLVPSERAKAAGAPVEVDISRLESGQQITVEWRGKPVWIIKRSKEMLDFLPGMEGILVDPDSRAAQQPEYAQNVYRSIKEDILVLVGICTHLGCSPKYQPQIGAVSFDDDWKGGFLCACHGSKFDLAGRVYSGVPAPKNLVVPPHQYLSDTVLLIGSDEEVA